MHRLNPCILILFTICLLCFSCGSLRNSSRNYNENNFSELSQQLENSSTLNFEKVSTSSIDTNSEPSLHKNKPFTISDTQNKIPKENFYKIIKEEGRQTKVFPLGKKEVKKPLGDIFEKHSNVIWKIGCGFLVLGAAIFGISAITLLKIGKGNLEWYLVGLLIGLALIVLSLPFLLIGAIVGSMRGDGDMPPTDEL